MKKKYTKKDFREAKDDAAQLLIRSWSRIHGMPWDAMGWVPFSKAFQLKSTQDFSLRERCLTF